MARRHLGERRFFMFFVDFKVQDVHFLLFQYLYYLLRKILVGTFEHLSFLFPGSEPFASVRFRLPHRLKPSIVIRKMNSIARLTAVLQRRKVALRMRTEVLHRKHTVSTTVLIPDGTQYSLGELPLSTTVLQLKQAVLAQAEAGGGESVVAMQAALASVRALRRVSRGEDAVGEPPARSVRRASLALKSLPMSRANSCSGLSQTR